MDQKNRNTAGLVLWVVLACAVHILLFRDRLESDVPVITRLLYILLAIAVTLPLHEVIHWVFMKLSGLKDARIEFARDPQGIPSLRTVAGSRLHGGKWIVILLAPFLLLTVVPDIVFLLIGRIPLLIFIMIMCNAAGCSFDMMDVIREISKSL